MGFINLAEKTINAKLVYYGVGMGGKTSSLQAVHGFMVARNEVQLVSIKTEGDATLLFDFLPINLGLVEGFKIRVQGYTVPGQPKYRLMRKYVLSGADAVVLVVDSERSRLQENVQALASLKENLIANKLDPDKIPIVVQYNKRDLDDILSEEELDAHFRFRPDIVSFPSVARDGQGVFEAFSRAVGAMVEARIRHYGLGRGEVDPADVANGAMTKLWEIHDRVRGIERGAKQRLELDVVDETVVAARVEFERQVDALAEVGGSVLSDAELALDLGEQALAELAVDEPEVVDEAVQFGDPDGLLDKTIRSNIDLAERYGELDQRRILLEKKNRELVESAQNAVHDLNRPLAAIKLFLSAMHKGIFGPLPDKLRGGVDNSIAAVRHMEGLVRDLVDSSRFDYDGVKLQFVEVDLMMLIAEVLRTLRGEIFAGDVRLRVEPLPVVKADAWALTKVFTNLLGNAMQYRHPERDPRIGISAACGPDAWEIVVADNGIGIPSVDQPRLFRRFERGSNTGGVSGTGLGLHIVREVVYGHGGRIWIESVEGEGTAFHLILPHEPTQPEHCALTSTADQADL